MYGASNVEIHQTTLEKVNFNKPARGKSCILKLIFERLRRYPCGSELIKPEKKFENFMFDHRLNLRISRFTGWFNLDDNSDMIG